MFSRLHKKILAYLVILVCLTACGVKRDPYYNDPSKAVSFEDLMPQNGAISGR